MSIKAAALTAALVCVILAPAVLAAGVEGEWEFKNQMPARSMQATMTITKSEEGKYTGTWSTQRGESELSDITFENGTLKFAQTASFGGQEMKTTYEGKVAEGKITGKATGRFGEMTFEGTKEGMVKEGADPVVGTWSLSINTPAREIVEKLTITKTADGTLAGKWEGQGQRQRGESVISNVKFEGGKLTFTRTVKFGDREMITDFSGTVEGDTIKGAFSSERGEREANATRVGAAKPAEKKAEAEPNKPK
jgi:hypothetical protein